MAKPFTVLAPASSSNLGSGFDTLSAALKLYLQCHVSRPAGAGAGVEWRFVDFEAPSDNVASQALEVGCRRLGVDPDGLSVEMQSPIPLSRGLGSSGAAIVAGLTIAEQLAGTRLEPDEFLALAAPLEGHPDNLAASYHGGWVLSRTDPAVAAVRLEARLKCRFVAVVPDILISTQQARDLLPEQIPLTDAIFNQQRCALLVHAIAANRPDLLGEATQDRMHQPYRAHLIPGADLLLDPTRRPAQLQSSVLAVTISGSGSTMMALVAGREQAVATWMVETLRSAGTPSTSMVLDLDEEGARVQFEGSSL